ncbi:MAG: leucyl aminopeptidase [Woeseiaceae bacterium]|jgi:leucyl aminopeptidase
MNYMTSTESPSKISTDCLIIGIYKDNNLSIAAKDIDKTCDGLITKLIKNGDVSPMLGEHQMLHFVNNINAKRLLILGLGDRSKFSINEFKKVNESAAIAIRNNKLNNFANYLTLEIKDKPNTYISARQSIEVILNNLYQFNEMKSKATDYSCSPKKIIIAISKKENANKTKLACEQADAISAGMNIARDLGNFPANICTPTFLAKKSQEIAKSYRNLSVKVHDEAAIKKLGMRSFLSVTEGSKEPAKLIEMHYKGAGSKQPIVLVGKGVTFDTGGISLKPSPAMDEMKYDMCGAATVIGTIAAVAKLQLPVNLTIVVPACENRPSSSATLPGDVIKSMSGQTIEILNTDAEGRLILCDALTYSEKFKPKYIIDVATLTGACVVALGHHRTAVMSNCDELSKLIINAGESSVDRAWALPMGDEYEAQLKSNFADFANIGGGGGGSITAACFLGKFTKNMKWAHLDIAGTAWISGDKKGSTGRPVPMLTEFIINQSNEKSS